MQGLRKILIKILDLFRHQRSYSQDGEDMVLRSFMESYPKDYRGFYVDVGAHHPVRFSNTYHFYRKGWRGINIDATPGSMQLFHWFRRRDINLELGIGAEKSSLTFYCFDEPALNTLSKNVAEERTQGGRYKIKAEVVVPIMPLREVLENHLPPGSKIDFFSVDVEGMDEIVLRSNDWNRFRPAFVLAEDAGFQWDDPINQGLGVYQLLTDNGYTLVAKTQRTLVFQDNQK